MRPALFALTAALALISLTACGGGGDDAVDTVTLDTDAEQVTEVDAGVDAGVDADAAVDADDGAAGDAVIDTEAPFVYPDPGFIHRASCPQVATPGDRFEVEVPTLYRTPEALPQLDVRALARLGGLLWAGGPGGLFVWGEEEDVFVSRALPAGPGPVVDIARALDPGGRLVVLEAERVDFLDLSSSGAESIHHPGGDLCAVAVSGGEVWVGAPDGLRRVTGNVLSPVEALAGLDVRDLAVDGDGRLWMATGSGVVVWDGQARVDHDAAGGELLDDDARAVAVDPGDPGQVWVGTAEGVTRFSGELLEFFPAGPGGLPAGMVTALDVAGERLLIGHARGLTLLTFGEPEEVAWGRVDHYVSQRWLPADEVQAVLLGPAPRIWAGTPAGLSRVDRDELSWGERAAHHEATLDDHFWRMDGFVASDVQADDAWEPGGYYRHDHDNDGLWTQMQIGAWCMGYAASGDEALYDKARAAMDVMFLQIDVPAHDFDAVGLGRGFVTRSLVRDDEGALFEDKAARPNWHLVEHEGRQYYWKDDTSSDETTGHFFGYPLFFDLCAKSVDERTDVANHAGALAGYILNHGFELIDLDGEKTSHGHWNPERIAAAVDGLDACKAAAVETDDPMAAIMTCVESWAGGGWLNALEILGHMLAAWHMTGQERFYDAYEELITVHRYDVMAMPHEETYTVTNPGFMNHSDHELAMLAYFTLIRYEPDDARRARWIDSLLFLYEHELGERNPLWGAFVALLAGFEHAALAPAVVSLMEMPDDRRTWRVDNTHRRDAGDWPDDRFGDAQFDRVFPYDEIRTVWWNGNLYEKIHGGDGREHSGPMAWLLPYYTMRHAGLIQ